MSLKVFKNKNEPTWAEDEFFNYLIEELKDTNLDVGLFFNVFVDGTELDTLIATEKGIFVLEYKNYSGKLFASENSVWKMIKVNGGESIVNEGRENAFQQARRQRFSLMNLITNNFNVVFPNHSIESKSIHHIGSYLIFEMLDSSSEIDLSEKAKTWLNVLSKENFLSTFHHQRPSNLTFSKDEIINLATLLKMDQVTIDEESAQTVLDDTCPVCFYSSECFQKFINCEIVDIDNRKIRVMSNDTIINLHYNKNSSNPVFNVTDGGGLETITDSHFDDTELKILHNIFDYFKSRDIDMPLEVNFFHLQESEEYDLEINDETLIVILPSWLYSVTSFANLDFCERNVLTSKFSSSPSNHHILRGNAVNESLDSVIENPTDLETAKEAAKSFVQGSAIELIASDTSPESIDEAIETEVSALSEWATHYNRRDNKNTEEFIISPKLGLKGKIDLVLKDDENRIVDILELKSSTPDWQTGSIKEYHELQVVSYGLMVLMRQEERFQDLGGETPSVLYSKATGDVRKPAKFDSDVFTKVFKNRNILLNSEFSLTLPNPYPHPMIHPNGCEKCSQKDLCMDICRIVQPDHCDPSCFKHPENLKIPTACNLQNGITDNTKNQFIDWLKTLNDIRILNHRKYSEILTNDKSVNHENGKILEFTNLPDLESSNNKKFVYKLALKEKNFSEFRQFDIILLSDKYDLEKAELGLGIIKNLTFDFCWIEVNKELKFVPKFIFPYYPDRMEYLNFVGLYKGFMGDTNLKRLISESIELLSDLLNNVKIDLLQGVPGSGKTTTVVNKVIELSQRGKKVFVATFTNKAIDNIHKKLLDESEGTASKIHRFGHTHRVEEIFHNSGLNSDYHDTETLKNELEGKNIFLSTIHSANSDLVSNLTSYDFVIIDEASQINIPMSFVPMSLSNNILLVGDHFQLPPLFSEEIIEKTRIKENLISIFEVIWNNTENLIAPENRTYLTNQYRMAEEIIAYPSKLFYGGKITTDDLVKTDQDDFISLFNDEWKSSSLSEIINPTIPSLWVQVNGNNSENSSRSNLDEANYCCEIITAFLESGISPSQIGVITPFRLQVNTIKSSLYSSIGEEFPNILDELQIDTIDRFQGSQKEIILISLCSSDLNNNFLIKDLRRLNVALTRPRFKRIILGNLQSFVSSENENNAKIAGIIDDGVTKYIEYVN